MVMRVSSKNSEWEVANHGNEDSDWDAGSVSVQSSSFTPRYKWQRKSDLSGQNITNK